MKKVKYLTGMAGNDFVIHRGDEGVIEDVAAARLVSEGMAEILADVPSRPQEDDGAEPGAAVQPSNAPSAVDPAPSENTGDPASPSQKPRRRKTGDPASPSQKPRRRKTGDPASPSQKPESE